MARGRPELVLLLLCVLRGVCGSTARDFPTDGGVNGFSLHPPYFNLAEGTQITATATCGEDEHGRPVQDLYCKLVGGPVSGDPSQTIQVRAVCAPESRLGAPHGGNALLHSCNPVRGRGPRPPLLCNRLCCFTVALTSVLLRETASTRPFYTLYWH